MKELFSKCGLFCFALKATSCLPCRKTNQRVEQRKQKERSGIHSRIVNLFKFKTCELCKKTKPEKSGQKTVSKINSRRGRRLIRTGALGAGGKPDCFKFI